MKTTDIKSAFLQGRELRRDVYIKPPKESDTVNGEVWKLKQGLYGLKDGTRQFYISIKEELLKSRCKISEMDPAVTFLHKGDKLSVKVCCHVDTFLHAGDEHFEKIMNSLRKKICSRENRRKKL